MKPDRRRRTILKATGGAIVFGTLAGCTDTADDENGAEENGMENGEENGTENGEENGTENGEENGTENGEENGEEEEEEEEMAMLRVAHLSPDAPNVDVYVNDEPALEDVPFRAVSDYLELEPNTYDIRITGAGDEEAVVFDEPVDLQEGAFTVAAIGEIDEEASQEFAVETYDDDLEDPGEDARIRAVHASPDAPNVDIAADGDVLLEDVAFGEAGAVEVPAGEYTLEVRAAGEEEAAAEFPIETESGMVYSAFAVGYLEPAEAPVDEEFDLILVGDNEGIGDEMNGEEDDEMNGEEDDEMNGEEDDEENGA